MNNKITVEVFKDSSYPHLDSDEIAHALATVETLKPYVEIINRNRMITLPDGHPDGYLEQQRRVKVVRDTDGIVLYTGRTIIDRTEPDDALPTKGVYLHESRLCVVSTTSLHIGRTARHELGHFVYTNGDVKSTTSDDIDHCRNTTCVMHWRAYQEKRPISTPQMDMLVLELPGFTAPQYEYAVTSLDFCDACNSSLGESAYRLATMKCN